MKRRIRPWHGVVLLALAASLLSAAPAERRSEQQAALSKLQAYVGSWRGVGQPRRGSTRGAWRENQQWQWSFADADPALTFEANDAKFLRRGRLIATEPAGTYVLYGLPAGDTAEEVEYRGALDQQDALVLTAEQPEADAPARITIRQVANGDRMLVLFERRISTDRFTRLAEVGLTREGSNFGQGTTFVECVVTGGLGTIPVRFEGKTYYVCCSGCRDYFNENAAKVIAEYEQRSP